MLTTLFSQVADHWMLSTYLGVMTVNESAILTAFSLIPDLNPLRILGVALASVAGALTNDLILYGLARFGAKRFLRESQSDEINPASFFERVFLGNTFFALLGIKFLFGVRLFLTIYLVAKKRIPLGTFILYDLCGIILYVSVIGGIGLFVGQGNTGAEVTYQSVIRIVTALCLLMLTAHLISRFLKQYSRIQ